MNLTDFTGGGEDPKKKALLSLMGGEAQPPGTPGPELGAIPQDSGSTQSPPLIAPPPDATAPLSPEGTPAAPVSNFGRTMGLDAGKFNDPGKHDFKYDTTRVLSRFDPRQGFTPDVINALNTELGNTYGTYAGSGDKLSLTGAKGAKDAADFANQDWIYAHDANSDATKWNFGGGGADGGSADVPNGAVPGTEGDIANPTLQKDLNSGVPTDNAFFQKLLDQARGIAGPAATDRKALLSLMK